MDWTLASGTPAPEQVLYSIRDSRWFKSSPRNHSKKHKTEGLPYQELPLFSAKLELFRNPKVVNGPAVNLIDLQRLPESRREALPCSRDKFGTEINFFSALSGQSVPNNSPNFPAASRSSLVNSERVRAIFGHAPIAVSEPPLPNRSQ